MNLAMTSLRAMLETAISVGTGVTVIGGGLLWAFREKVGLWVDKRVSIVLKEQAGAVIDARIKERFGSTKPDWDDWRLRMEVRMTEQEKASDLMAQVARSLDENVRRLTMTLEKVGDALVDQGKELAKQGGTVEFIAKTMERRSTPR